MWIFEIFCRITKLGPILLVYQEATKTPRGFACGLYCVRCKRRLGPRSFCLADTTRPGSSARGQVYRGLCVWLQMPTAVALALQWGFCLSENPEQLFSFSTVHVYAHDLSRTHFWPPWRSWCSCRLAKLMLHFSAWNGLAVPLTILLCRTNCFFGPVKCPLVIFCRLVYYLQMIRKRPSVHSSHVPCAWQQGAASSH